MIYKILGDVLTCKSTSHYSSVWVTPGSLLQNRARMGPVESNLLSIMNTAGIHYGYSKSGLKRYRKKLQR